MNKRANPDKEKKSYTRRQFFKTLLKASGLFFLAEGTWIAFRYLKPQAASGSSAEKIRAGKITDYPVNSVTYFADGQFFLTHLQGGFLALSRKCPHLGCVISWEPEKNNFFCPCHAGVLNIKGEVLGGPVPRPLDLFSIEIVDRQILVDTSTVTKRTAFDESQLIS